MLHNILLIDGNKIEQMRIENDGFLWISSQEFMQSLANDIAKRYKDWADRTGTKISSEARVAVTGQYGLIVYGVRVKDGVQWHNMEPR